MRGFCRCPAKWDGRGVRSRLGAGAPGSADTFSQQGLRQPLTWPLRPQGRGRLGRRRPEPATWRRPRQPGSRHQIRFSDRSTTSGSTREAFREGSGVAAIPAALSPAADAAFPAAIIAGVTNALPLLAELHRLCLLLWRQERKDIGAQFRPLDPRSACASTNACVVGPDRCLSNGMASVAFRRASNASRSRGATSRCPSLRCWISVWILTAAALR